MIKLRIFLILLFSTSKVFAQTLPSYNFNILPKDRDSEFSLDEDLALVDSKNYLPTQDTDSSYNSNYKTYQEPDLSNKNYELDQNPTPPDSIFNNSDYLPDQDPALFSNSDLPDQDPKIIQNQQINDEHELVKTYNPRSTIFAPQKQTPTRVFSADLSKPEVFINSNNLIRKTGSFYQARGEVISVEGKVTDSFGVPIQGAIIEIWQTNSAGKYQNLLEKNSRFMDIYFNMSGRAITDNLGNYSFLTIMPGSYLDRAPHINLNIYHEQFGRIETEFYFDKHPKNELDYEYLSYSENDRKLLTANVELSNKFDKDSYKRCYFNIVMSGVHKYKSFGSTF